MKPLWFETLTYFFITALHMAEQQCTFLKRKYYFFQAEHIQYFVHSQLI